MADEEDLVQDESSEEELKEAAGLGWVDKPKFRGDPAKWVPAKEFLERGRHILPIMKENNQRLAGELAQVRETNRQLAERLKAQEETTEALREFYAEETNRRVKEVRAQVKAQLKSASEAGDHEAVAELTDQLTQLNQTAEEREEAGRGNAKTGKGGEEEESPEPPAADPVYLQWAADNADWWEKDVTKTQRVWLIAQELRTDRANDSLVGRPFFDRAMEVFEERYGEGRPKGTRVEASRGGATQRRSNGKSFSDLPKEARDACHQFKNLIGEGPGKFKTMADWEKQYAKDYFEGEEA